MGTSEELSGIDNKVSPSNKPPFNFLLVQNVHFNTKAYVAMGVRL